MTDQIIARYRHPQGARIEVYADGTLRSWDAHGRPKKTSATAAKLAAGHGAWALVEGQEDERAMDRLVSELAHVRETRQGGSEGLFEPQLLEHLDQLEINRYVTDDAWIAEAKIDGVRCCVEARGGRIRFLTRGGRPLVHAASALHFERLTKELQPLAAQADFTIDGELLPGERLYVAFDLVGLRLQGQVLVTPGHTFAERRTVLEFLFRTWDETEGAVHPSVVLIEQAHTALEKAGLMTAIYDEVGEGVVFKRLDATYDATGGRVRHTLKLKFERTYDLVVTARDTGTSQSVTGEWGTTKNATLAYWDGEKLVPAGSCSMLGKPDAKVGDVVEVKALYWSGSSVYQPTLLRIRDDKQPHECTADQFRTVSRKMVSVPR